MRKQRRGTAIVESSKGILVVSGRRKLYLLPGGGTKRYESRRRAALRELHEETGLNGTSSHFLFRYVGPIHRAHGGGHFRDYHKVFLVKALGLPKPHHEIKHVAWYKLGSKIKISLTTSAIIRKYSELVKGDRA